MDNIFKQEGVVEKCCLVDPDGEKYELGRLEIVRDGAKDL